MRYAQMNVRQRTAQTAAIAVAVCAVLLAFGCSQADSGARGMYNDALAHYGQQSWQAAADGFLAARDAAGQDSELRFRAAFNLGATYAKQADAHGDGQVATADPHGGAKSGAGGASGTEQAIASLRQSAAWFRDAVRLAPSEAEDQDARTNLETVLRRIQVLADQLNQGQNSLQARLQRVIEDQRGLRDQIRQLMDQVAASASGAEPLGFQREFDALATEERRLLADVGTLVDLAGEELQLLQEKGEAASEEEQVRAAQLQALDHYLQAARRELSDARRALRRLQGDRAHLRADAGLAVLKRAHEQLMDPITVLRAIAQDESALLMHTGALAALRSGKLRLAPSSPATDPGAESAAESAPEPAAEPVAPAWLTNASLEERQRDASARTRELLTRFQAAVAARADEAMSESAPADAHADAGADPKQARMLAAAAEAVPHLEQAVSAMDGAAGDIVGNRLSTAVERQNESLVALVAAIERFADIRALVELVHGDHTQVVALLASPRPRQRL